MKVIYDLSELPNFGCVLSLGKFESIHKGHQQLIKEVAETTTDIIDGREDLIQELGENMAIVASAIMIFDPHPYTVLDKKSGYKPLFSVPEREHILNSLAESGQIPKIDYLIVQPFNKEFSEISPDDFCIWLFNKAWSVIVGEGYRFGRGREGTTEVLQLWASALGSGSFAIKHHASNALGGKISTSRIRELLAANKFAEAHSLLGFNFFVMGIVTRGKQLGRTIGIPTLNIYPPSDKFLPANGVYVTRTHINGVIYKSITNIGIRPTVTNTNGVNTADSISVETHLLDFHNNENESYGQSIKVEFLHFIRPEQRFPNLAALQSQIATDIKFTQAFHQ